jgi:predicted regulator of Ras-like GTPase activity (Roadblock/LC7/MglB family)
LIICSNCGTTNNESAGNVCRKCGALLPRSRRPPRIKIAPKSKEILESQGEKTKTKTKAKAKAKARPKPAKPQKRPPIKKQSTKHTILDLHEIQKVKALEIFEDSTEQEEEEIAEDDFNEDLDDVEEEEDFLKEIAPQPFRGSIIADKGVYGQPKQSRKVSRSKTKKVSQKTATSENIESSLLKQKQLEEDMTKVLSFLSKKITVKPLKPVKKGVKASAKPKDSIPPSSMNEILKDLLNLDVYIEASAIIKKDGTILASALSSRISDSLFATIAANLSMMGVDIIEGLSAGSLLNMSIRGTDGVLDLAPITFKNLPGNEMILIIFSHPKIKSGIIHFAVSIVKKRVKQYLGLSK